MFTSHLPITISQALNTIALDDRRSLFELSKEAQLYCLRVKFSLCVEQYIVALCVMLADLAKFAVNSEIAGSRLTIDSVYPLFAAWVIGTKRNCVRNKPGPPIKCYALATNINTPRCMFFHE